jgi:hypothetical protein
MSGGGRAVVEAGRRVDAGLAEAGLAAGLEEAQAQLLAAMKAAGVASPLKGCLF